MSKVENFTFLHHQMVNHHCIRESPQNIIYWIFMPGENDAEKSGIHIGLRSKKQWSDFLIFTCAICVHLLDMFFNVPAFGARQQEGRLGRNTPKDITCKTMNNLSFCITRLLLSFPPSIRMYLNDIRAGLAQKDEAYIHYASLQKHILISLRAIHEDAKSIYTFNRKALVRLSDPIKIL